MHSIAQLNVIQTTHHLVSKIFMLHYVFLILDDLQKASDERCLCCTDLWFLVPTVSTVKLQEDIPDNTMPSMDPHAAKLCSTEMRYEFPRKLCTSMYTWLSSSTKQNQWWPCFLDCFIRSYIKCQITLLCCLLCSMHIDRRGHRGRVFFQWTAETLSSLLLSGWWHWFPSP